MAEQGLAGLIVADPLDVRYLTGFGGEDSVLVLAGRRRVLVTDSRYVEQVRQECPGLTMHVRTGPMASAVGEVLGKAGLLAASGSRSRARGKRAEATVGIESDSVTVRAFGAYRKAVGRGLKAIDGLVVGLRSCKDEYEVGSCVGRRGLQRGRWSRCYSG